MLKQKYHAGRRLPRMSTQFWMMSSYIPWALEHKTNRVFSSVGRVVCPLTGSACVPYTWSTCERTGWVSVVYAFYFVLFVAKPLGLLVSPSGNMIFYVTLLVISVVPNPEKKPDTRRRVRSLKNCTICRAFTGAFGVVYNTAILLGF